MTAPVFVVDASCLDGPLRRSSWTAPRAGTRCP